ncbi:hypothetical protein KSS87_000150 [Heliosperma pusillum]|nr:hypothetical protein KSS87_000150 [Heliosperma pusillum]
MSRPCFITHCCIVTPCVNNESTHCCIVTPCVNNESSLLYYP